MRFDRYTYTDAVKHGFELEALLEYWGISIRPGSVLEAATLGSVDILERRQLASRELLSGIDWRDDLHALISNIVGVTELATQLLRVRGHPDFGRLVPHLSLLNEGQPLQTRESKSIDQGANKVFELLTACWVMGFGANDVFLDHPQKSTVGNPDVLFTFDEERWGIACKALHSVHPQTILEKLRSGIRQIERSEAKRGIVLLSSKNIIAHNDYFRLLNLDNWRAGAEPIYRAFSDRDEPFQKLRDETDKVLAQVRDAIGVEALVELFTGSKTAPAIVVWAHIVSAVVLNGNPVPTSVRSLIVGAILPLQSRDSGLLAALNDAAMANPEPNKDAKAF